MSAIELSTALLSTHRERESESEIANKWQRNERRQKMQKFIVTQEKCKNLGGPWKCVSKRDVFLAIFLCYVSTQSTRQIAHIYIIDERFMKKLLHTSAARPGEESFDDKHKTFLLCNQIYSNIINTMRRFNLFIFMIFMRNSIYF